MLKIPPVGFLSNIFILVLALLLLTLTIDGLSQADNEIQVYSSPTIGNKSTILELHSNYTFNGSKFLLLASDARWTNFTVEVTHGFANNFEIGLYLFTAVSPNGKYQYLGNQIRPRVTVPEGWSWPFGASLSLEVGFFRPDESSDYIWQGEVRPIIDKTINNWYFSFNPNMEFALTGSNRSVGIAPQFKTMFAVQNKVGLGFEYYGFVGTFNDILPGQDQEHLLGPIFDLLVDPDWELNLGVLFGFTDNSNQQILKVLVGRRFRG